MRTRISILLPHNESANPVWVEALNLLDNPRLRVQLVVVPVVAVVAVAVVGLGL